MNTWQLPEGIDELIGDRALVLEHTRRQLIDLYIDKGFNLVVPPMVENIESLLPSSYVVNEKTFKFLDPISGKMLGVHADITPQIARIDAKYGGDAIAKYCYVNAILQTKADDFYTSRSPIQAGAELYGSNSIDSDVEIIGLMLESLRLLAIEPTLSLGNIAVFDALIETETLSDEQVLTLKQIFIKRSAPDLEAFLSNNRLKNADKFSTLMKLEGGVSVLYDALHVFENLPRAKAAIQDLLAMNTKLDTTGIEVVIDLAELKAYEYHTGIIFSAYNKNYSKALAQGGRYNGLSESFGQPRAATGFSFDLKFLTQ